MAVAAQEEILSEKRLIRIFRAESMKRSPFRSGHAPHPVLAAAGICFVDDPAEADVILAERIKFLKEYLQLRQIVRDMDARTAVRF